VKTTTVEFLANCADDRAGEIKSIEAKRAQRLVRTGYARLVERAVIEPAEDATRPRPRERGPRGERRG
jgi:hypothetical protein